MVQEKEEAWGRPAGKSSSMAHGSVHSNHHGEDQIGNEESKTGRRRLGEPRRGSNDADEMVCTAAASY